MIRPRIWSSKLRPYLLALLTLPALLLSASSTEAALLPGFTGNTTPADAGVGTNPGVDGTINFAVFQRNPGSTSTTDPWGTGANLAAAFVAGSGGTGNPGSPVLDLSAQYLFLFQTVNDAIPPTLNNNPISENSVNVLGTNVTSWGRFTGLGFVDSQGAINGINAQSGGNPFLGTERGGPGDRSGARTGVTGVTVAATTPTAEPDNVFRGANSIRAVFITTAPDLQPNAISSIWGYTSNSAPSFPAITGIIDGGTTADGEVPQAGVIPEPSTLLMGAMAVPALLICLRRKSKAAV